MMKRICKQCGKEFVLTDAELDFYKKKNLTLPKRCKACREKNKRQEGAHLPGSSQAGQNASAPERKPSVSRVPGNRPNRSSGGKGFMTVAAGIILLLAMFFVMKQNGMFSQEKDQPQAPAGIQTETLSPSPEAPSPSPEAPPVLPPEVTTPSPEAPPATLPQDETPPTQEPAVTETPEAPLYTFRSEKLLLSHYEKHGLEMGFDSAKAYEAAANQVIQNPDVLHKLEAEDGDDVYYLEATNEFVVVSTDGYIRTYFNPDSGIDYFNRQ